MSRRALAACAAIAFVAGCSANPSSPPDLAGDGGGPDLPAVVDANLGDQQQPPDQTQPDLTPPPDLAQGAACCGTSCQSCLANPSGHACVAGSCGCTSALDCALGEACDGTTKRCTTQCGPLQPCRGGCCLSGTCAPGGTQTACGASGSACVDCSTSSMGGLCQSGACGCGSGADCPAGSACDLTSRQCTTRCSASQPCQGACCAGGTCASGTAAAACGGAMMLCVDCTGNPIGHACVTGACGCNVAADCPPGNACDPTTHRCGTACAGGQTCNGGCCDGTSCVLGTAQGKCGATGGLCLACGGATGAQCLAVTGGGACGCNGPGDCPAGQACNVAAHQCTTACSGSQACNGGCCAGGTCAGGTSGTACGASGSACVDCSANPAGHACRTGACGCANTGDCPAGTACDLGTHLCTATCSSTQPCNGGCCQGTTCAVGTAMGACGASGAMCSDCSVSSLGKQCLASGGGGTCGCTSASDCGSGSACDPVARTCTTACGAGQPCNGGCCQAGTCVAGTVQTACGPSGSTCADCTASASGRLCLANSCGCNSATDCAPGKACDPTTHRCTSACSASASCNGGCCQGGTCVLGTANGACGATGASCIDCGTSAAGAQCRSVTGGGACGCASVTDCPSSRACDQTAHACTVSCGAGQPCNGGCCASGTCSAGTGATTCGASGNACLDCSASAAGHVCIGGAACGCATANDCALGQACDTTVRRCTTTCSPLQACRGGCCQAGTCAAGTSSSACGAAGGACLTCAGNSMGSACVTVANGGACGCNVFGDCPTGNACNTTSHACSTACGAFQPCNGACCQASMCAPGTAQTACGPSGSACVDCTMSTAGPLCLATGACGCNSANDCPAGQACDTTARTCTTTCSPLQPCHGGCCAGGTCAAGTLQTSCGATGALCVTCVGNPNGGVCEMVTGGGSCGCGTASDCALGTACDGTTRRCTTACSGSQLCNGGCCASGMCNGGSGSTTCGANGNACVDCSANANGHTCLTGACGCNSASDCPVGRACDTGVHLCTTVCSATQACNGGCCAGGTCNGGTAPATCGASGNACVDCTGNAIGRACVAGACGCNGPGDCPSGRACDLSVHQCVTACSGTQACNGGCCASGMCNGGTTPASCGASGSACVDCTASASGHLCVAGACGCNGTGDCPAGTACNTTTHLCTTACSGTQPCNGGCCAGGTCNGGTASATCGAGGNACLNCTAAASGHLCIGGASCGCNTASDCPAGTACNTTTHLCTTACSGTQPCNGGCCAAGTCNGGSGQATCGASGNACVDCTANATGHACVSGGVCGCNGPSDCPGGMACNTTTRACTTACSGTQLCNGGCCNAGTCDPGTGATTCGAAGGACLDCSASASGHSCVAGSCGCNSGTDCASLRACNTTLHVCTTACSGTQLCNAGCCASGTCNAGTGAATCGGTGAACTDCTGNPTNRACIAGSSCGCNVAVECAAHTACDAAAHACTTVCSGAQPCNGGCCNAGSCANGNVATACGQSGAACVACDATLADNCSVGGACQCGTSPACGAGQQCSGAACVCLSGYTPNGPGTCTPTPPRPIAPLSTGTVTMRKPTFTWVLAAGTDGARIDICADRACSTVEDTATLTGSPTTYTTVVTLGVGIHYWRLFGRVGTVTGTVASPVWELSVPGRDATTGNTAWGTIPDWDGDGYADAAIGTQGNYAYVHLSNHSTLNTTAQLTLHNTTPTYYGEFVASAGDVNGDGYPDLIVSSAGTFNPLFEIHAGGPSGVASAALVTINAQVSLAASAGDIDRDGYADVVAILPGSQRATVYYGSATGFRATTDTLVLNSPVLPYTPDGYSFSIASGDVDGDGYTDVAIGEWWYDTPHSRASSNAWIFRGGATGISTTFALNVTSPGAFGFGTSVALLDANGDGYADLVVGAPGNVFSSGTAAYYYQSAGASGITTTTPTTTLTGPASSQFGISTAAAGDVNGDGYPDLIVGANYGAKAYLFAGGAAGLSTTANTISYPGLDNNSLFGTAVIGAGDVNKDGYADVLISATAENDATCSFGAVYLFTGQAATAPTLTVTKAQTLCGPSPASSYGITVATLP